MANVDTYNSYTKKKKPMLHYDIWLVPYYFQICIGLALIQFLF